MSANIWLQLQTEEPAVETGSPDPETSQQTLNNYNKTKCRRRQPDGAFLFLTSLTLLYVMIDITMDII